MRRPYVGFHFALVQDVAVLRPLARLAATMPDRDVHLLVSDRFARLDADGRWMGEIERLGAEIGVRPQPCADPYDALRTVGPGPGLIVAGSESPHPAHVASHQLFRALSGRVRTATLQHGFECLGFLHNARHDRTSGRAVAFAADIAVGWFELARLRSVTPSQRSKIFVAGPPMLIAPPPPADPGMARQPGMVCENLHSVRFASGRLREGFLDAFDTLAERLGMIGQEVALRPHPAGHFRERHAARIPANVTLRTEPLYDLDLRPHAFAISAPSTVLFDFVLARVPVAMWADPDGGVDTTNFTGLATVADADDWWRFALAAIWERDRLIERQTRFVADLGIPIDVRDRYRRLLALAG